METQHHGITEDQKPKQLDISMPSQIQLFEAISCLPECSAFPNWASLKSFYSSQRKRIPGVPTESGNGIYNLKLSVPADSCGTSSWNETSGSMETVSQATEVVLPVSWQQKFPVSVETPLGLVPCPKCRCDIKVTMSYVRKLDNQFQPLPVAEERNVSNDNESMSVGVAGNASVLDQIVKQMKVRLCVCVLGSWPKLLILFVSMWGYGPF